MLDGHADTPQRFVDEGWNWTGDALGLGQLSRERHRREPALELLAPVPLNIVCFRVRALDDAATRALVADLQEAGLPSPSTTVLHNRVAIRAAIVNHRTTPADVQALVDAILARV